MKTWLWVLAAFVFCLQTPAEEKNLKWAHAGAPLGQVLMAYEDITGQTLLVSPTISRRTQISFSGEGPASDYLKAIESALKKREIGLTPITEKFTVVLPPQRKKMLQALNDLVAARKKWTPVPQTIRVHDNTVRVKFSYAPFSQMFDLLSDFTERRLAADHRLLKYKGSLKSVTNLTYEEAVFGLELYFMLHGVTVHYTQDGLVEFKRMAENNPSKNEPAQRRRLGDAIGFMMMVKSSAKGLRVGLAEGKGDYLSRLVLKEGENSGYSGTQFIKGDFPGGSAEIKYKGKERSMKLGSALSVAIGTGNKPSKKPTRVYTGEELKKHLRDYNLEVIRKGLPPLPLKKEK